MEGDQWEQTFIPKSMKENIYDEGTVVDIDQIVIESLSDDELEEE